MRSCSASDSACPDWRCFRSSLPNRRVFGLWRRIECDFLLAGLLFPFGLRVTCVQLRPSALPKFRDKQRSPIKARFSAYRRSTDSGYLRKMADSRPDVLDCASGMSSLNGSRRISLHRRITPDQTAHALSDWVCHAGDEYPLRCSRRARSSCFRRITVDGNSCGTRAGEQTAVWSAMDGGVDWNLNSGVGDVVDE